MTMTKKVFLNDNIVDCDQAHLSVAESGFLYGAGLFETMRSHNGVVFRRQDHLDRLFHSAAVLAIDHSYQKAYIGDAIANLLEANELSEARLRLTLTNGPLTESQDQRTPTLLITATEFRPYPAEYYKAGVLVILCPFRQNATDPTCGHKTTCYYPRLLALNLARQKGAVEAIWFTTDNHLAEGCVSNVFLVKDSVLYTPPIETPVLPGIARKAVRQLAQQQAIDLVEKDLSIDDLLNADEVFLTNVIMEVLPVIQVERHTVGDGKVGPVTKKIRESFLRVIDEECRNEG
jgi:branched-chain amino acid aminotransferase